MSEPASRGGAAQLPRRRAREPMLNMPGIVLACCIVLVGIHAWRLLISIETDNQIIANLAFMPARVSFALHIVPAQLTAAYNATAEHNPLLSQQIDFLIGDGHLRWWTFITYALLHGSWAHVGFNCLWLVAYGSPVARRFTPFGFLLLMLVAAIAGAFVEFLASPTSFQIIIGASAAVSGAMGAATRFVFRPSDEPKRRYDRTQLAEAFRQPALNLRQTFTTKAALIFIIAWFGTNILFGYFPCLGGMGDMPIAWQAHIGGFLVGLFLFPLFDPRHPRDLETPTVNQKRTAVLPGDSDQR